MALYIGIMAAILIAGMIRVRFVYKRELPVSGSGTVAQTIETEKSHETRKLFTFIFLGVFWCLCALKGHKIGSDTDSYMAIFDEAVLWADTGSKGLLGGLFNNTTRYETGYIVLNRIIALLTDDVQWLFVVVATFSMVVLYKLIVKESRDPVLSVFLFISLRFLYFMMSGLRQGIAIFLCVIAYRFIKQRKLIPFVLLVLLASQFHMTAILFLIAYPLSYLRFNNTNVAVVTFVGVLVFLMFNQILTPVLGILPEYYSGYTESVRFAENKLGNILVAVIQAIFLCVSLFSSYRTHRKGEKNQIFTKEYSESDFMHFMMLISILFSLISLRATTLDRLYYYFWIFAVVYIPNVLREVRKSSDRVFLRLGTITGTFLYNITLLYFRPEWTEITPFKFFWQ